MRHWDLMALPPSTEKRTPRQPGPDAPRVPSDGGRIPRVLFSSPECRAVVVELAAGEAMGDHRVHERAVVHVVSGRVVIDASHEQVECAAGKLITFEPSEHHSVRALSDTRLLLLLAPWPAPERHLAGSADDGQHLPANAVVEPDPPLEAA